MTPENAKHFAEIIALAAAAFYFAHRAYLGYFLVNLTVSITASRIKGEDPKSEVLAVAVNLLKGDRGKLQLHDAQVRVSWLEGIPICTSLLGVPRLSYD